MAWFRRIASATPPAAACIMLIASSAVPVPAGQPAVWFPASTVDSEDLVHLRWYAPAPGDPTQPAELPAPALWLESSPESGIAMARQLTTGADSSALYAIDLYIRAPLDAPFAVQLWSDQAGRPLAPLSDAAFDGVVPGHLDRLRYRLSRPLHIQSITPLWVIAILPRSSPARIGLTDLQATATLTSPYPFAGNPLWQIWPDHSLGCALVATRSSADSIAAPDDSLNIGLYRLDESSADTTHIAQLSRYQTAYADLPALPGLDITYIWQDPAGTLLSVLTVPYSLNTALAWTKAPNIITVTDSATETAILANRSSHTLEIVTEPSVRSVPDGAYSGALPDVRITPDRFTLESHSATTVAINISSEPGASGNAMLVLTALDSGAASARPAVCTLGLQTGLTGVPAIRGRTELRYAPYPNPTNSAATLPVPPGVRSIDIFNTLGARVDHLVLPPLTSQIVWPPPERVSHTPSGTYLIRFNRRGNALVRTLTVLR